MAEPSNKPASRWSTFAIEQKVGAVVFGVTGVVGLVLGIVYISDHLRSPFEVSYTGDAYESLSEREARELEEQKNADSDGDGISDYDELNVYRTSPYLVDSDSDGFDDAQEIHSGNNPNCPVGETCGNVNVEAGVTSPVRAADVTDELPFPDAGLSGAITSEADIEAYLNTLSIDNIREALVQSGVSREAVDGMSDDELQSLFDEALDELAASGQLEAILSP